ncbi:MAG: tripartite tricarboxylate transporter TctB family protein [Firmicutes bacterium]|nr:tripartite tricarboxylate transporter TctB family protein [Dethiobacter sp.]MBS3889768.1 tripartite tricarboxylate transporter TctB family protein [Bacillota bacterium]MBS4054899.1 tripartite tricarboxylate transporter TctB family protein [Thermaerobacter sp.]
MGLELLFNGALLAFFTYCYFYIGAIVPKTTAVGWGAEVWPQAILVALIILLGANMYKIYRGTPVALRSDVEPRHISVHSILANKLVLSMVALLVYAICLQTLGFILSTFVFFAGYARIVGQRQVRSLVLSSLVATLSVYFVFSRGLGVMLPRGIGILRDFALILERL